MAVNFASLATASPSDIPPAAWRRPFSNWLDGIEPGWAIPLLLLGFAAAWVAYFVVAYLDGDLHSDVLETWTLGRTLQWGYTKHPPLMGWAARAWTSVFPLSNWSFQLLAMINSGVGLWAVDLISRRFVSGDKRAIVLLLLMLTPVYQLHAQRFNANAVLLSSWPLATYCFLRSFESRRIGWAIAAGAAAALAMLGKYYSVFLIASFLIAAIWHPQRRAYFGSWAPWVSTVSGLAILAPHLHWLATTGAPPFSYALTHEGKATRPPLIEALLFLLGIVAALAFPAVSWMLIVKSRLKRFPDDFRAMNPNLYQLVVIGIGTIVLPTITCVWLRTDMPPIWAAQGLFLIVIPVVCSTSYAIERLLSVNLSVLVISVTAVAVFVVAPVHAIYRNTHPLHEARNFYREAALELTRQWHAQSDTPLPAVGGDEALAFAVPFYSPDHPAYEWQLVHDGGLPDQTDLRRGWAALCHREQDSCIAGMHRVAAQATRFIESELVLQSTLLDWPGTIERFIAVIVPPSAGARSAPSPTLPDGKQ